MFKNNLHQEIRNQHTNCLQFHKFYRHKLSVFRNTFCIFLIIGINACATNEETNIESIPSEKNQSTDSITIESIKKKDTILINSTIEEETEIIAENNWQISDYITLIMDTQIATEEEYLSPTNKLQWYYQIKNNKNGFASITGAIEGWKEFAIWRMADGNDLIGEMTVECGPACGYSFQFYKGKKETITMQDQKDFFPLEEINVHAKNMQEKVLKTHYVEYKEDISLVYKFPKLGTSMIIDIVLGADEIQIPILELGWNKSKFFIQDLYYEIKDEE